jgi:hypothetical protein
MLGLVQFVSLPETQTLNIIAEIKPKDSYQRIEDHLPGALQSSSPQAPRVEGNPAATDTVGTIKPETR